MNITYEPNQIPEGVHEISFSDEPTLSEAVMGKRWSEATSHPLDDISEMVKMVRMESGISPPEVYFFNVKTLAYIMLGSIVENIESGIDAALNYQLQPVKFTDHLSDCFGWAKCW